MHALQIIAAPHICMHIVPPSQIMCATLDPFQNVDTICKQVLCVLSVDGSVGVTGAGYGFFVPISPVSGM